MKTKTLLATVLAMALMLPFTGCGGGGSDSSSTVDASGTSDTGTVALMLTDGPTDDFDHIWITVSKATLLSEGG